MKEQQRENHRSQERQRETPSKAVQAPQAARLPAQRYLQLLWHSDGLLEMPALLLQELAQAVGNESLAELLRQTGGGACGTYVLREWPAQPWEEEPNFIQTAPPELFPFPGWPEGGWEQSPSRPGSIRDRGP